MFKRLTGLAIGAILMLSSVITFSQTVNVSGALKKWDKVTVALTLPSNLSESDGTFRNNRMDVVFTAPSGKKIRVPGFFAADGNAANSGATSGKVYKAFLRPDETGNWSYQVLYYTGTDVASKSVSALPSPAHSLTGSVGNIGAQNAALPDLKAKGRLLYQQTGDLNARRYLRFAETGEYFLKHGPDSPENFLDYNQFDFDDSRNGCNLCVLHYYSAHAGDYKSGDPTWGNGKGKNIIGAVNYLQQIGVNSMSMSLYGGDDKNVFPWIKVGSTFIYDISKLAQWEIVLDHAEKNGLMLHLKLAEAENWNNLNSTQLKVYYREMVARFGHHLGVEFNFSEEYASRDLTYSSATSANERIQWLDEIDPWGNNHVMHTRPEDEAKAAYDRWLELDMPITGASMQNEHGSNYAEVFELTHSLVVKSKNNGTPWVVASDEQATANNGVFTTMDQTNGNVSDWGRKGVLWGNIMAGGAGVMWYGGANGDFKTEDFRRFNTLAAWGRHAVSFFQDNNVEFWKMVNNDALTSESSAHCLAEAGKAYVIYLPGGGSSNINLNGVSGTFNVKWFDPRNGGALKNGSVATVSGGGNRSIGNAPNSTTSDWVVLVTTENFIPVSSVSVSPSTATLNTAGETVTLNETVLPGNATNKNVTWSSSNLSVATVNNGVVTAVGAGTAKITAITVDGGKTAECNVTVNGVPAQGVTLDRSNVKLGKDSGTKLNATVLPTNAANKSVTWSSSNTDVATVSNGTVTGKSIGTATITVKTVDGGFTASCDIIVTEGGITYGSNWIVFESDITSSDLGAWVLRTPGDAKYHGATSGVEPIGNDYLEFTGNNEDGGSANSPLKYTFKCPKTGKYRLGMRLLQNLEGAAWDKCNDVYIKLEGNFTSGNEFSTDDLKHDHKFYGRGKDAWGAGIQMEGHINGVKKLVPVYYNLTEGEEYTFTMSGRAQRTCIDYIIFYESTISYTLAESQDIAAVNPSTYWPDAEPCNECACNPALCPQEVCTTILSKNFDKYSNISGYNNATLAAIPNSPANAANVGEMVLGCGGANGLTTPCAAEQAYNGPAGDAIITVNAMGEPDGECTYEVFINGVKVGEKQNTRIFGTNTPAYTVEPLQINTNPVAINTGDIIRVTFNQTSNNLVPEGSGYATARGRWRGIDVCVNGATGDLVSGISLSPNSVTFAAPGETKQIAATVSPATALNKTLNWTSNNTAVATVNSNGVVTAVSAGNAVITAKSTDGSNISANANVTVNGIDPGGLSPVHDAYLQGSTLFNSGDLRVEAGNRTSYLMFDLSALEGDITSAKLVLSVSSDAGNGEIQVNLGTSNNWTETTLSSANVPAKGQLLGSISGSYAISSQNTITLDPSLLNTGGKVSFVVTHVSGNDVSFASKENSNIALRPVLKVETESGDIPVESIYLSSSSEEMREGTQLTLDVFFNPEDATNQNVTWSSSNEAIATVANGVVTAVGKGDAVITATSVDGSKTSDCNVTVTPIVIAVTGVTLNTDATSVLAGKTVTLTETIEPADATNKNVTWSSSNEAIATVANGVVTGISAGTSTIICTAADGSNITASCIVTVKAAAQDILTGHTLPAEIIFNGESTFTISYETTEPRDIHVDLQNTQIWKGFGSKIVTVDGKGTATIKFTPSNNPSVNDTYQWIVYMTPVGADWTQTIGNNIKQPVTLVSNAKKVETVSLSANTEILTVGENFTLTETVLPVDADNKTVIWSSNNETVATVVNGVVTALSAGNANITVTTVDGGKTAICAVTVKSNTTVIPVGIQVDDANKYLTTEYEVGSTMQVTVSFNAGAGKTVSADLGGIQVMLRECTPQWAVAKDYIFADASVIGQQQGTITISVDLTGVPASAELTNGNFYFLFPRFVASDGTNYWVDGLVPINIVKDNIVGIEDITIEAENFTATGGTINDAAWGGPGLGVNKTATNINWVNSGDYTEYTVNVAQAGEYIVTYYISTPSDNAQIQILVDGTVASTDNVTNNGQWDSYYALTAANSVYLTAGTHTIRINATGTNAWQWNLDKIVLSETPEVKRGSASIISDALEVSFFPNPADDVLNIELSNSDAAATATIMSTNGEVVVSEQFVGSVQLFIGQLSTGIYILQVNDGANVTTEKIVKN